METLKEGVVQQIVYGDSDGKRDIIPTFVPDQNVKAIDVTDLSFDKKNDMEFLVQEYAEYVEQASKTIFNFEDWVELTKGKNISPKWRTFKLSNLKKLP